MLTLTLLYCWGGRGILSTNLFPFQSFYAIYTKGITFNRKCWVINITILLLRTFFFFLIITFMNFNDWWDKCIHYWGSNFFVYRKKCCWFFFFFNSLICLSDLYFLVWCIEQHNLAEKPDYLHKILSQIGHHVSKIRKLNVRKLFEPSFEAFLSVR